MWHEMTVSELSSSLEARAVDPCKLFAHFWQRIEQGPQEVWTFLDRSQAEEQAHQSQRRWLAGKRLGPLDGIPVAIKDAIDVRGQPTTAASATRRNAAPASEDAPIVARLRQAGAVLMGKTNLSEFAFSGLGINPHFGTPVRLDHNGQACAPGGSSSGSAMALAHGMVPLAVGTDTSGSVRIPSAWNRLVGLRPSAGRYPDGGVFPLAPAMDVCGPMARNLGDMALLDAVLAGNPPLEAAPPRAQERPRLWVAEGRWLQELDPVVEQAFLDGISRLQRSGWEVQFRAQPAMQAAMDIQAELGLLVSAQSARVHAALLGNPQDLAMVHEPVRIRLQQAAMLPREREQQLLQARQEVSRQWNQSLGQDTVVVIPTTAGLAPALSPLMESVEAFSRENMRALRNTLPSSFIGAPSITLPLPGTKEGAGIHISAAVGQDDHLIAACLMLEQQLKE